jgi:predicted ATPase
MTSRQLEQGGVPTIVLTGGPCAGKSALIAKLPPLIETRLGWHAITIPETVAWMGGNGMRREDFPDVTTFQSMQTRIQASHEDDAMQAARSMGNGNVLILMDRAIPDAAAYLPDNGYRRVLAANGLTKGQVMGRYDVVIFLHSVACRHGQLYRAQGNSMRIERNAIDAERADERTLMAYATHPHVREIADTETIDAKMEQVMEAVADVLSAV